MNNLDVLIKVVEDGFNLDCLFKDIVPDIDGMDSDILNSKLSSVISSRLIIFIKLLDLIARKGDKMHWHEMDVALTILSSILEENGLVGANSFVKKVMVDAIRSRDDI